MAANTGESLIAELLANPQRFDELGRAYDLLQTYFAGYPLDTLRALLRSNDIWIQRSASFIASELGKQSQPLVTDVIPLLESTDPRVQDYAMQVLTVCCEGENAELFGLVAKKLESNHEGLQWAAINLTANADIEQLEAAARFFENEPEGERHRRGLRALAARQITEDEVEALRNDPDPLIQRYGEVVRKRLERSLSSTKH